MKKKRLEQKLARLNARLNNLSERVSASTDAAEVRSLTEQVQELNEDIADVKAELAEIEAEETRSAEVPAEAKLVNPVTLGKFSEKKEERSDDFRGSMEYRNAFWAYCVKGTPLPSEFRSGNAESTKDTGAAIPITIVNDVINTVRKRYGNLYNKVKKTSVAGGVEYPIGALEASFKWINESTVSPRQKAGNLDSIIFKYNTAEIRIAQTFLANLLTLSSFEARFAEIIVVAYLKAMDQGIVNGSGQGSMLGILNDPRVTNTVTMTAAQMSDWTQWRKRFFASLPLGYRSGEFIFASSTVDAYLETENHLFSL